MVSGQLHAPAALPRRKPPVRIGYEVGWDPEPVGKTWRREKSRPYRDSNADPLVVHSVASRYTVCALPTGISPSVERRATDWMVGVRIPAGARDRSLLHSVQTGCGAHPTSYSVDTGAFFRSKAAGA
jgi:hypothetical protein